MNLWMYSLREMRQRPGRSLLTLFSIVLSVGTVYAVSTTIGGARIAYSRMTEALSGKADAQVVARGGGRFSQELVEPLVNDPAVQNAVPLLYSQTILTTSKERIQINGVGTVLAREKMLRPFNVVAGRLLQNSDDDEEGEIVIEESLAHSAGIKAGDDVKLLTRRGVKRVQVVGLIRPTEVWAFTQGGLAYLDLKYWQALCKATGKIDALQIALAPSADKEKALASLAHLLPPELQLRSAQESQISSNVTLIAFQVGLEASRILALLVAFLLILNTFLMNVTERRGQLAVMRLVGATQRQIMALLLREGALVGTIGALLGLGLGRVLTHWMSRGVENAFAVKLREHEFDLAPLLFAFAMGPAVAMLAAFVPAWQASRISPLETLRQRSTAPPPRRSWKTTTVGCLLLVVSLTGMYLGWIRALSQEISQWMTGPFLIGLVLVFPLLMRPGYGLAYRLLRFLGPMEFELAYGQMVRSRGRALLTWGILFMAVAVSAAAGLILTDVISDIRTDVRRTTLADFLIRVTHTNLATGASAKLPEGLAAQVNKLDGVQSVETMGFVSMEVTGAGRVIAVVREFGHYERPPLELGDVDVMAVQRKILEGEIVLSDILAYKLQRKAGDEVAVEFAGKTYTFRVAGTSPFFLAGGMAFFADRQIIEQKLGPLGADALMVNAAPAQRESLGEHLRALCLERGLLFQTYAEVQERLQNILNTVVASLWVLLGLVFLIAVFGVTNTLMMNILEQTREIGLMRVLGMQRRQIRRMILAQSAYVGLLAILPGIMAGVFLAYVVRSSSLAILGDRPHFGVILPWLVPYAAALLGLVLLFGWLPAARGARLNILESIRTE